jgi:hypothetical protein
MRGKTFGVRVQKINGDWKKTWAYEIDDSNAKREGYDKTTITGSLKNAEGYPGCPYCGNEGVYQCSCGKLSCDDFVSKSVHCYWCGQELGDIPIADNFNASTGAI